MKKSQILGICILASVIAISLYMFNSRHYVESDPFASMSIPLESGSNTYFTFKDEEYTPDQFNNELLEALYAADVRRYQELKTAIYIFGMKRYQRPNIDINKLPPLTDFFQTITNQKLFKQWYELNKNKYKDLEDPQSKAILDFQIQKISEAVATDGQSLVDKGLLKLNLPKPRAPLKILNLEAYPSAGDPKSKNRYVFINSYLCKKCFNYNKKIRDTFVKEKNDIFLTLVPFTIDPTSPDALLTDAALCVHRETPKKFWIFHNTLLANKKIYELRQPTQAWDEVKETLQKIKIEVKQIDSCLKDKKSKIEIGNLAQLVNEFKPRQVPIYFHNGIDVELFGANK